MVPSWTAPASWTSENATAKRPRLGKSRRKTTPTGSCDASLYKRNAQWITQRGATRWVLPDAGSEDLARLSHPMKSAHCKCEGNNMAAGASDTRNLMHHLDKYPQSSAQDQFKSKIAPDGTKWAALRPAALTHKKQNADKTPLNATTCTGNFTIKSSVTSAKSQRFRVRCRQTRHQQDPAKAAFPYPGATSCRALPEHQPHRQNQNRQHHSRLGQRPEFHPSALHPVHCSLCKPIASFIPLFASISSHTSQIAYKAHPFVSHQFKLTFHGRSA